MANPEIVLVSPPLSEVQAQCNPAGCAPFCDPIQPCAPEQSCSPMAQCTPEMTTCYPTAPCNPDLTCMPALGGTPCIPDYCSPNAF